MKRCDSVCKPAFLFLLLDWVTNEGFLFYFEKAFILLDTCLCSSFS